METINLDQPVTSDNGTFRVRLEQDSDPAFSPRDTDDNVSVIVAGDSYRHNYPQEGDSPRQILAMMEDAESWNEVREWLIENEGATRVLPLYSGPYGELLAGQDDDPGAPNGVVGVAYDNHTATAAERTHVPGWDPEPAMRAELQDYNSWATGDVYGYVVEKLVPPCECCGAAERWDIVESVWGFIGYEYAIGEAREALRAVL